MYIGQFVIYNPQDDQYGEDPRSGDYAVIVEYGYQDVNIMFKDGSDMHVYEDDIDFIYDDALIEELDKLFVRQAWLYVDSETFKIVLG